MRPETVRDYDLAVYLNRGRQLRSAAVKDAFAMVARSLRRLFAGRRSGRRHMAPSACPAE